MLDHARSCLAVSQQADGRIPVTPDEPYAFWPTELAVIAWQGSAGLPGTTTPCGQFPTGDQRCVFKKTGGESIAGHDTSLLGWSWTEATSPFVEPTALAVLALDVSGHGHHPRVKEASLYVAKPTTRPRWLELRQYDRVRPGASTPHREHGPCPGRPRRTCSPRRSAGQPRLVEVAGTAMPDAASRSVGRCSGWALGACSRPTAPDRVAEALRAAGAVRNLSHYIAFFPASLAALSRGDIRNAVGEAGYVYENRGIDTQFVGIEQAARTFPTALAGLVLGVPVFTVVAATGRRRRPLSPGCRVTPPT